MSIPNGSDLLGFWGAALATILAVIKIYEFWRERKRMGYTYYLEGGSNGHSTITISNLVVCTAQKNL